MNSYPKGHEFEFKWLRPSDIYFDHLYQRPLDSKKVAKIAKEWNGDLFNEPKISWRDGKYWCFNGQHTIAAWVLYHHHEDKLIFCKVFKGMTWSDECQAFIEQNGIASDPTGIQKLKAHYNNREPEVVDMVNKVQLCGFIMDFSVSKTPNRIVAVNAAARAYRILSPDAFVDMFTVIKTAWDGEMEAVSGQMISALTTFYKTYYGNFRNEDLAKCLKKVAPEKITRRGKVNHERNGCSREILYQYNYKRKSRRLDETLL